MAQTNEKLGAKLDIILYAGLEKPEDRELLRPEAELLKTELLEIVAKHVKAILAPGALDSGDIHRTKMDQIRKFTESL